MELLGKEKLTIPVKTAILSSTDLQEFVQSQYGFSKKTICNFFCHGLNDTYQIKTTDQIYYLRVYRYKWRTKNDIIAEIQILNHLKSQGINVSAPVAKADGTFLTELDCIEGKRYAVLFYNSEGKYKAKDDSVSKSYGKLAAMIHLKADQLPRQKRFHIDLKHLLDDPLKNIKPFLTHRKKDYTYLANLAKQLKNRINELLTKDPSMYGYCHGDHHGGNVYFDEENNGSIFDFDCGGYGWRAYDLAVFIWSAKLSGSWTKEDKEKADKLWDAFLAGYTEVKDFSENEKKAVYAFVAIRHIWLMGLHTHGSESWGSNWLNDEYFDEYLLFIKNWIEQYPVFEKNDLNV